MSELRFFNVWSTDSSEARAELARAMESETRIFVEQPGFISLTGWEAEADNRVIAEARWENREAFEGALHGNPAAHEGRARMERLGREAPGVFTPAFVHTPPERDIERATLPGFERQLVDIGGVRLNVVRGGSGSPVLLVHGWPSTWWAWRKIMPSLARDHAVVAIDLRGLGDSDRPGDGYDKQTVAEDLHRLVQQLNLGPVALVAHDMGGPVAYTYAVSYPGEVDRFAFLESGLPGFGLEAAMDVANGGSWHFGFNMAAELPEQLVAGRERLFLSYFYKRGTVSPDAITNRDIDEFVRSYSAPGGMKAAFDYYRTLFDDAAINRARPDPTLHVPVLAIDGAQGLRGMSADAMRRVCDDVRTAVVSDAGHFIMEDNPVGVLSALEPFLAQSSVSTA
jgi:pimeloyl-ACP methyl ester carboxylesterase/heme-degrading monooxygenase HmoA